MSYQSINPANTSDVVATFNLASVADIVAAAEQAKAAQKNWANVPAQIGRAHV